WPDDEDCAHGGVVSGSAALGSIATFSRQHAIELGDLELRVADHRIVYFRALRLLDVLGPFFMIGNRINAQPDNLGVALGELGLHLGHVAELSGAEGGEIFRMRE